ncbi:type II toxin-antitoxin system VapC family toxin [Desulfobulbus sp. F1]|nr:type II toxin-antitoxin system VapC family toxin [Desulfobulbus sp. F1]
MKPRVYLETTVISYLTAWRSPQLIMAAQQEATRSWWDEERHHFDLFVSEIVVQEALAGDGNAARRRMEALEGIPELRITDEAIELAKVLINRRQLPEKARLDALHIAVAAVHAMEYLLTWNCRHIANATAQKAMRGICKEAGCTLPLICTPLELIEERNDD